MTKPMAFRWADHVGELELRIDAADEAAVFADALAALHELLADGDGDGVAGELCDVTVEGGDRARQLAAWLEELSFLAESEGLVPVAADELELEPTRMRARVRGFRGDPPHLVKAVTYHRLAFEPHGDGWRAVVVLDV